MTPGIRSVDAVGTRTLFGAIADPDRDLDFLPDMPLEVLVAGIRREMRAGNLTAELDLTPQGESTLRHPDGCWRIDCRSCTTAVAVHIGDELLIGEIFDACERHACPADAAHSRNEPPLRALRTG